MNTAPLPPPYFGGMIPPNHDPHAPVDAVTHVWNRLAILQIAARMLDAARKRDRTVGYVLVAVDPRQETRTIFGAAAADAMLREVCRRVRKALSGADAIGRYGRDELLVVLPGRVQETIAATADQILQAVKSAPILVAGMEMDVTIAIGATSTEAPTGQLDEAIVAAGVALHRAKAAGRDCVEMRWATASTRLLLTA